MTSKVLLRSLPDTPIPSVRLSLKPQTKQLALVLSGLPTNPSRDEIRQTVTFLEDQTRFQSFTDDADAQEIYQAIVTKVVIAVYADALEGLLSQASIVEAEAEWWAEIERSRSRSALFLLQTLPFRLYNGFQAIARSLQERNIPLHPSVFTPSSLRRLFPSQSMLRPGVLSLAFFPHIQVCQQASPKPAIWAWTILKLCLLPLDLTQQECKAKRKSLESMRDEKAQSLGSLVNLRDQLSTSLRQSDMNALADFTHEYLRLISGEANIPTSSAEAKNRAVKDLCSILDHNDVVSATPIVSPQLQRPSHLTLLWPRLLIIPPLAIYFARTLYISRGDAANFIRDTTVTVNLFVQDWLIEPLKGVIKTIRAGGEDGVIVRPEGVAADVNSLERMTLSLAQDKLNYNQEQLAALSRQVRMGDFTPILEIYEDDIKRPLKSALMGSLLRSVFIQVQKAKVDIDQTLSGIDKLLKSQELTFAFVGVAPAFALVYITFGYLGALIKLGLGRNRRYGGDRRRAGVWGAMRRIERLLLFQPKSHSAGKDYVHTSIPPLTTGLLLLSVSHLRTYAEARLPSRSTLRSGFLEDVADLEDPALGRTDKLRVIDRMWKSWGLVLGWTTAAEGSGSKE